jgi:GNAT superfamily N-acetyltransferase
MKYLDRKMFVRPEYSYIMRYGKSYCPSARRKTVHPKRYKDMYSLLCKVFPKICRVEKSDEWVYTTALKERRGFVSPVCIYNDSGSCACCGIIDAQNTKCSVLGAVAVSPENRSQGFGLDIVCSLLYKVIEQDKVAYLNCSEEVKPFYESIGFKFVGVYAQSNQV